MHRSSLRVPRVPSMFMKECCPRWQGRGAVRVQVTLAVVVLLIALPSSLRAADLEFARDIRPVLSRACYDCHGPDADAREGDLRLDDRAAVLQSDALKSGELLKRLTSDDPDLRMPPPDSNRTLSSSDRAKLVQWIKAGAAWPEDDRHWAFQRLRRPNPPPVKNGNWARNEIDRFVLAKLEARGLQPSPEADKATLLRRVTFDLTGLPPTPQELDAFLEDHSPNAYETVVDRLLASSRFGEHMALDWLEASRYADTDGY